MCCGVCDASRSAEGGPGDCYSGGLQGVVAEAAATSSQVHQERTGQSREKLSLNNYWFLHGIVVLFCNFLCAQN